MLFNVKWLTRSTEVIVRLGLYFGCFSNEKMPYCISFNPDDNKQHLFIDGCADKRYIQGVRDG